MNIGIGGIVSLGGGSSGGSGSTSGITSINGQTGPVIVITGVNGIVVTASGNQILIDGAGASGTQSGTSKFAASFSSITSGVFTHGLNTLDVLVQVFDNQVPRRALMPDDIVLDNVNQVSLIFNTPQSGRIVII